MEQLFANADGTGLLLYAILNAVLLLGGLAAIPLLLHYHRRNPPNSEVLTRNLQQRALSALDIYTILMLYICLLMLASFSGRLFYADQIATARLVVTLLIYIGVSFSVFAITRKRGRTIGTGYGLARRDLVYAGLAPLFYLALVPLLLTVGWILNAIGYDQPLQSTTQQFLDSNLFERVLFFAMAVIGAPFFEELIFRGILFPAILRRMDLPSSILLVSTLFALLHFNFFMFLALFVLSILCCVALAMLRVRAVKVGTRLLLGAVIIFAAWASFKSGNFHSFVSLMLLSGALCLAYWRTASLWPSIVLHAIFNGVTLLALSLMG